MLTVSFLSFSVSLCPFWFSFFLSAPFSSALLWGVPLLLPFLPHWSSSCLILHCCPLNLTTPHWSPYFCLILHLGLFILFFVCVLAYISVPISLVFCVASFYGRTLIILTFSTSNRSSWAAARLQSSSSSSRSSRSSRSLLSHNRPILEATRWNRHSHHSPNSHSSRWQLGLQTPNQGQVCTNIPFIFSE